MLFGVYGKSLWGEVMTQEALKLALEALEANDKLINGSGTSGGLLYCMDAYYSDCFDADPIVKQIDEAVAAIKEALAQPEQKPVAWRTFDGEGGYDYCSYEDNENYADDWNKRNPNHKGWVEPLYTLPPQRTDQEHYTLEEIDNMTLALTGDEGEDTSWEVLQSMVDYVNRRWPGKSALQVLRMYDDLLSDSPEAQPERTALQIKKTDPFESARVADYNRGWNDCLFASGIVKQTQRTWVGLTDDDTFEIGERLGLADVAWIDLMKAIEAKLKQKNG